MCCWQLVFSFFGKSNILISFLQNSINKAYNGMAGACGVSSPGLSPLGARKDLGCSAPGSASRRLLLPFLAGTGPALPSKRAWPDTLVLCREVIPGSLPPPPPPLLCLCGTAANGSFSSVGSITGLVLGGTQPNPSKYLQGPATPWGTAMMCSCPGCPQPPAANGTSRATVSRGGGTGHHR